MSIDLVRWRDEHHMLPLLLIASVIVLVAIGAAVVWSRGTLLAEEAPMGSRLALQGAYDRVQPGTTQAQLASLGFDSTKLKARTLSGLGVQEYFMPATSQDFDRMDPAVRACFDGADRCRALVFPLAAPHDNGFMAANAAPGASRAVFLLKSGRVAYKAMQGA